MQMEPTFMLPSAYLQELQSLEEELAAGDITRQGFEKRKKKLDEKWIPKGVSQGLDKTEKGSRSGEEEMHPTMMLMSVADTGNVSPVEPAAMSVTDAGPLEAGTSALANVLSTTVAEPVIPDLNALLISTDISAKKKAVNEVSASPSTSSSFDSPSTTPTFAPQQHPIHPPPSNQPSKQPALPLAPFPGGMRSNCYHVAGQQPFQPLYPSLPPPNRYPPPLYPNHPPPFHHGVPSPFYPVAPPQPPPLHHTPMLHRPSSLNMGANYPMPSVLRSHSSSDVSAMDGNSFMGPVPRSSSSGTLDQLSRQAARPISAPLLRSGSADAMGEQNHTDVDYYGNRYMRPSSIHSVSGMLPSPAPQPLMQNFMPPPPSPPRTSTNNHRRVSVAVDQADAYLKSILPFLHKQMAPVKSRELPSEVNDDHSGTPMIRFGTIASVMRFRSKSTPRVNAFTTLDSKGREVASITYEKLHTRAERIAIQLREKSGLSRGDNVLLVYKRLEFIESMVAMLGCFYAGMVAVPLVTSSTNLEDEITESLFIMENCRISLALTTDATAKSLAKDFMATRGGTPKIEWWKTNEGILSNTKLFGSKGIISPFSPTPPSPRDDDLPGIARPEELAYVEYSKNAIGELKGVLMDHQTIFNHSYVFKGSNEVLPSDTMIVQLEPRQQFVPEVFNDPGAWNSAISRYKASVAISDNACMLDVTNSLRDFGKKNTSDLSTIRLLLIDSTVAHPEHTINIATCLKDYGLKDKACVVPVASVSELGGVCLSTRDTIGMKVDKNGGGSGEALEVYVDYDALVDSRVEILGYGSDFGVEVGEEKRARAIRLTDSGFPYHGVSILVVEPESRIVLPKNCVGEIFVHSLAVFPKGFWALPKLSEQTFRVHPIVYKESESMARNSTANSYMNPRRASTFSVVAESLDGSDFVRTGLYGFVLDSSVVPSIVTPRLFLTGIRRDLLRQRRTVEDLAAHEAKPSDYWVHSKDFNIHISSDLVETCFTTVFGIESCAIFSVAVGSDHLPVVLVDTARPKEELRQIAVQISTALEKRHRLRPYCIAFCANNSLPRLKPDSSAGTGLQTSSSGYTAGVVSTLCGASKPGHAFSGSYAKGSSVCRKLAPLDIELCRSAFLAGDLSLRSVHMNTESGISTLIARFDPMVDAVKESEILIPGRGSAPLKVGQVVGGMLDVPVLDDKTLVDLNSFPTVSHLLRYRADINADKPVFTVIDHKGRESKVVTFRKFSAKVHTLAHFLVKKRGIKPGEYVMLVFPPGLEYLYALHACLYAGIIPIPLSPPDINRLKEDIPALLQLASEFGVRDLLCNSAVEELFKGRPAQVMVKAVIQQQQAVDREEDIHTSSVSIKSSSESIASISSQKRPTLYLPNVVNTTRAPKLGLGMSTDDPIFFHSKLAAAAVGKRDPTSPLSTLSRLRKAANGQPSPTAMVMVTSNADLLRTVVRVSHATLLEQCRLQAIHARILESCRPASGPSLGMDLVGEGGTNRPLISCVRSYNGLGLVYSTMLGIYVGSLTIIVPPFDFSNNPLIWFETIHRYQVKDAFATYPMLEHALTMMQDYRSFSLQSVRSLAISIEGRNRPALFKSIVKTFLANQLERASVATTYSTTVNPMISTRGYMTSELTSLYIDLKAMRRGRVQVVREVRGEQKDENKDKSTIMLHDSGRIPNNTIVAIVNPTTRRLCSPNEMGEIWVCSPANIDALEYDDVRVPSHAVGSLLPHTPPHLAQLNDLSLTVEGVDPNLTFARTGDMGFLWPISLDGGAADDVISLRNRRRRSSGLSASEEGGRTAGSGWERLVLSGSPYEMVLFVVGGLTETVFVDGLRHFPVDVERTVEQCHRMISSEGCVVFKSNSDEIVCVVECNVDSSMTLLGVVPRIVTAVLEEHQFFVDVICFVKLGHLARSRLQEKQRSRIRLAYHLGKL
ncbi:hypothetical protein HDU67_007704 [Dinochytrium kinnereticum]|nr:hypothetical protein HDU67_007704 [Dinochytrium kinnereticum]